MKYQIGDVVELKDGTQTAIRDIKETLDGFVYGVGDPSIIAKTEDDIVRKVN